MIFQHSVKRCIYAPGIIAEVAEIFAYKRQLCFLRIYPFYTAYFFYCFCLKYIAPDTVNSIGRIDNNSAIKHALCKLLYKTGLWVIGMEVEEHVSLYVTVLESGFRNGDISGKIIHFSIINYP